MVSIWDGPLASSDLVIPPDNPVTEEDERLFERKLNAIGYGAERDLLEIGEDRGRVRTSEATQWKIRNELEEKMSAAGIDFTQAELDEAMFRFIGDRDRIPHPFLDGAVDIYVKTMYEPEPEEVLDYPGR